jgi:hypothetical protein
MSQWHEQAALGKLKAKLKESQDRCAGSELSELPKPETLNLNP